MTARKVKREVQLDGDEMTPVQAVEFFRENGIPDINKRKVWWYIETGALKAYRRRAIESGRPFRLFIKMADADAFLAKYRESAVPAVATA